MTGRPSAFRGERGVDVNVAQGSVDVDGGLRDGWIVLYGVELVRFAPARVPA
ncbi:hypothetical protein [Saccharopolyspora shandongensis]|uniref:hypothetical protein n=1 Tax=Saccharopolyspora shandongensis TaxID=418495 RepID=UPI0015A71073|nr:hypothetical protein [Saccharopolyspora shandongensis]